MASWASFTLLVAAVAAFLARNLSNDAIWGDESDGVFRSLGYPSGDEIRGVADVLEGTRATNDAGGFDLLLHWWMQAFGTGIISLRWLPAVFFLVYLVSLAMVGRRLRLPWWAALAVVGAMLVENITPYYALEIRPYAPMLAASVAMLALTWWLAEKPGPARAVGFIAASIVLISHHYSGIAPALGAAVLLIWSARRQPARVRAWLLGPAAISFLLLPLMYLALRGSPFGAQRTRVWYLDAAMLRYADPGEWAHLLSVNLLSPTGLPRTVFVLAVPALILLSRRHPALHPGKSVLAAWAYVVTVTGVAVAMSLGGFLPWYLGTRWSISDVGLIGISLAGLVALALPWIRRSSAWLLAASIAAAVAITLFGSLRLATYERGGATGYLRHIGQEMLAGGPESLTVDAWIWYDVRYLIERSGRYDDLRSAWNQNRSTALLTSEPSGAQQVREFLVSDRTRMLLRNTDPLDGVSVPSHVTVTSVAGDRGPTLLVKQQKRVS